MASSQRVDHLHIFSELDDPERQVLITELDRKFPSTSCVSRRAFWFLWLADIPRLKREVEYAIRYEEKIALQGDNCYLCPPKDLYQGAAPNDSFGLRSPVILRKGLPQATKSITASEQATLNRDKNQCVLTKRDHNSSQPTIAHIFPARFHRITKSTMESTGSNEWPIYESDFGKERVQKWQDAIQTLADGENPDKIHDTDRPQNMITLDKEVQRYWEDDLCVFRPISVNKDKSSMELAFHWLPMPTKENPLYQLDTLSLRRHPYPKWRMGCDDSPGNGIHLYDADGKSIYSGYIFTITTDDPIHKPLPSMDLLDMQWMIKRSSRFAGCQKIWKTNLRDMTEDRDVYSLFRGKKWNSYVRDWLHDDDPENEQDHTHGDHNDRESEPEYSEYFSGCVSDEDSSDDEDMGSTEDDDGDGNLGNIKVSISIQLTCKKSS